MPGTPDWGIIQLMIINDPVYGQFEIKQPIILKLIQLSSLQRLKDIDQAGYFEPFYPGTSFSRFEHSLGVFYLLKKYGAPLEEQVAGLIHDVSHAAFSHCIDYVLAENRAEAQKHQDNIFEEFVSSTQIPTILGEYNLDLDYITDESNFPLLEKELPYLCADRIDYSLRTGVHSAELKQEEAQQWLSHLNHEKNNWFFDQLEPAWEFTQHFKLVNDKYYAGLESAMMFATVSDYLKYALQEGYIDEADLYKTDGEVLSSLAKFHSQDQVLDELFQRMNTAQGIQESEIYFDRSVACKSRVVDPLFLSNGKLTSVSAVKPKWKRELQENKPKRYFLKY